MDLFTQYAMVAADEAIRDSGLKMDSETPDRIGVIVGSGIGGMIVYDTEHRKLIEKGPRRISPFFIPMMIPDIVPGQISIKYGLKGPNYSSVSACASGAHAIGLGMIHIQRGDADIMVVGGTEGVVTQMAFAAFSNAKALSTRNDDPSKASRPFDKDRDGFVIGEGAGIVILEELEHAKKRGARIYAEFSGFGFTSDAYHITAPHPEGDGAIRAMRLAVKDSRLSPDTVDYVNAHGTSTGLNDKTETLAIKAAFGDHARRLQISSNKSMIGHLLGASGAVEFVATALTLNRGVIPPTINYQTPDPECDLDYVPNEARTSVVKAAVSNSFGFGGHNVSLCLTRFNG
jgi:3-oxoacyl-[acyl-carrier-protein] synthase II